MESSDLRIFQAVAREGSITKAAARLGYVQSNVTARIRLLETELNAPLFYRHNRGMSLSPAGKTLLAYADKIVGLLDEARNAFDSLQEPSGPLLIGSTQSAAAVRLPKLLAVYHERYPAVHMTLTTGASQPLIDKMLQYEFDGAFIGCDCSHPELAALPAFREELVVASAPAVTRLEEALSKPILVLGAGCSYRTVLETWLHDEELVDYVIMEFGTLEAILGCVASGLGISLLPKAVVGKLAAEGEVRLHDVPESIRYMNTVFITRKDAFASGALRAFIDTLTELTNGALYL